MEKTEKELLNEISEKLSWIVIFIGMTIGVLLGGIIIMAVIG